jgi:hypothetical protein
MVKKSENLTLTKFFTKRKLLLSSIFILGVFFIKKILVVGMIIIGAIFFPEASQILRHYCFGDGSTLYLKSDYIKKSRVVKNKLKKMTIGQKKKVGMHQWEDFRLAYALNPFTIEKRKNKAVITQWIQFDKTNKVITWFGPIPLPDNIVHTFECTPFLVYHEFDYSQ